MFAMTSFETPRTSRTSLPLLHMLRIKSEPGTTFCTISPMTPERPARNYGKVITMISTASDILRASVQTHLPPWTSSPAPVGKAAPSTDSSCTRPRRSAILLLCPGIEASFSAFASHCCLPFGTKQGPLRAHLSAYVGCSLTACPACATASAPVVRSTVFDYLHCALHRICVITDGNANHLHTTPSIRTPMS